MLTRRDRFNKARDRMLRAAYRASGGRVAGRFGRARILLLTTTGRSSGKPHTVPLIYMEDGDRFAVTASNAGQDHHPSWFRNLMAQPEAVVEIGTRSVPVRARVADEAERESLWPQFVGVFKGYQTYQRRTDRRIPVILLEPR